HLLRVLPCRRVGDGQGDTVAADDVDGLGREEARVADLQCVADGPSALGAEAGISHPFIVVAGEPAGGLRVGELLVVGDETASLDGEDEVGRGLRMPLADRARPGEAVEGAVDLDGPEAGRRVLQFPSLGEPFRVEAATPVPVAPARNADPDLGHRPRLPGGYGGKRISRGPPRT